MKDIGIITPDFGMGGSNIPRVHFNDNQPIILAEDQDAIDAWFDKREADGELNESMIDFEEALALSKEEEDDNFGMFKKHYGNNKKKVDPKKAKVKAKAARKARKGKKK